MHPSSTFADLLALSAFDGDPVAALAALRSHFVRPFVDCSIALLQVDPTSSLRCRIAGLITCEGTHAIENRDPLGQRDRAPPFDDALARAFLGANGAIVLALDEVTAASPLAQALLAPASLLALPIANAGSVRHWIAFGGRTRERFDAVDVAATLVEVNLAAQLVARPLATRALVDETTRQRHAIEGLADIQRRLLPDDPVIAGLDYAIHWQPAETAAGDYYDLMSLTAHAPAGFVDDGADLWAVMLADVSGHGAAAAMEAVQFDAILRTYDGDEDAGPAGALTYANRHFFSRRQRGHFLTAFALLYRPDLRRATYVDAGHPPLLHRHAGGVAIRGGGTQIPLGILRDHVWHNEAFEIASGDVLVLYTDGIVEARDASGTPFGMERLTELVRTGPAEPSALRAAVRDALIAHQGGAIGSDDQTLIVLRIAH